MNSMMLWLTILAAALGTLMMRLLPLFWAQARLHTRAKEARHDAMPRWLGRLGPLMIAALLGHALVPSGNEPMAWLSTLAGASATLLVWYRTRSLGWPVLAGVAVFGMVTALMGS
ncbi:AzlD domain-containing protein [Kushneria phosphatilytica]|uniref:AzlD domain-containing protein n=1 Tax=Kushneria phosphatilytica TaxID=657387 RepID=A0A1S1NT56_9GAMM|nr:AzlD domain-containing protein [Kushneria phosphatilytica]OHV12759.1 branched-chain amino acid ABC transporter [Kushneria phosphatilytica]QEL10600.1 AzlD domain-containing protein [Kushneria phosphatilytica]